MKLISRSQFPFQGQGGIVVSEGDEFYIDGDTPEKDLSQRGKEFLGGLRSCNQFLYPDTPEAKAFLADLAKRKDAVIAKKRADSADDAAKQRASKQWYEKPSGLIGIAVFSGILAGVAAFVLCEYLTHKFPSFFHSHTP